MAYFRATQGLVGTFTSPWPAHFAIRGVNRLQDFIIFFVLPVYIFRLISKGRVVGHCQWVVWNVYSFPPLRWVGNLEWYGCVRIKHAEDFGQFLIHSHNLEQFSIVHDSLWYRQNSFNENLKWKFWERSLFLDTPLVTYLSHCCSYQPELVTLSIVSGAASVSSAKKVIVSLNQIVSYFVILVMFALANKYISHFSGTPPTKSRSCLTSCCVHAIKKKMDNHSSREGDQLDILHHCCSIPQERKWKSKQIHQC